MMLNGDKIAKLDAVPLRLVLSMLDGSRPEAGDDVGLLDMRDGESDLRKITQGFDQLTGNLMDLAVNYGKGQEAQRIRRDTLLSRRGHVARITGCLDLVARRLARLDRIGEQGKEKSNDGQA